MTGNLNLKSEQDQMRLRMQKRASMRKLRVQWKAAGLCISCGKWEPKPGKTSCIGCINRKRASGGKVPQVERMVRLAEIAGRSRVA